MGIDVVDVRRIARLLCFAAERFAQRWFTAGEQDQCGAGGDRAVCYAARLAAKEAVWKSLGLSGDSAVPWQSIEILESAADGVTVSLRGPVAEAASQRGVGGIQVSWARAGEVVTAVALASRSEQG